MATGVAVALALADTASLAAASWEASLAPWGGWFPPPSLAGGDGVCSANDGGVAVEVAVVVSLAVAVKLKWQG